MATRIHGPKLSELERRVNVIEERVDDVLSTIATDVGTWYRTFDDINVTRSLWLEQVNSALLPLVLQAYDDSALDTWKNLSKINNKPESALTAALVPRAVSDLTDGFFRGVKRRLVAVGDAVWNAMRLQLLQGLQFGENVTKLRDRLVTAVESTAHRARSAARTEVVGASNAGSVHQMKIAQVSASKMWVAENDDRVRPSHQEVDGTQVDVTEKFNVGGYPLDYPHDPAGPPSETYGCRCTLVWNVDEESRSMTDSVDQLLTADTFHLPGKHEQKNHGRRYKTPGDRSSGLRERETPKQRSSRETPTKDSTTSTKPEPVTIEPRDPATNTPTPVEPEPAPVVEPTPVIEPEPEPEPTPIADPVSPGRAAGTPATQQMLSAYDTGYTVIDRFDPGASNAKIDLLELSDGTRVVRKSEPVDIVGDSTRSEYLAGLIINAVGIDDVHTAQLANDSVLTTFVPGPTGSRSAGVELQKVGHAHYNEKLDELMLEQAQTPGGKSIGMADWLTDNTDRHSLNWIMTDDGARPIDQGKAKFIPSLYPDEKGNLKETVPISPFTQYWLGIKTDKYGQLRSIKPKFTRAELNEYRERINGLRDEFDRPGEDKFFDAIIRRLDMVEEKVKK